STKPVSGVCSTPRSRRTNASLRTRCRSRRISLACSCSGRLTRLGMAAFNMGTSPRSTKAGSAPMALAVKDVPDRGEPTTKTSLSSDGRWTRDRVPRTATRTAVAPYVDADQAACLTTCTNPTSCTPGLLQVRAVSRVKLSHGDRLLFPGDGVTKGDLFAYYDRVAPVLVPHLRDRPFTL